MGTMVFSLLWCNAGFRSSTVCSLIGPKRIIVYEQLSKGFSKAPPSALLGDSRPSDP